MVEAITQANLAQYTPREYILLCGHGGTGKSSAILSVARLTKRLHPEAIVYIIDTENGLLKLWKRNFSDVDNIQLYICRNMDEVIMTFDGIVPKLKAVDWVAIESMARIWEYSQNLGYGEVTGMTKAAYLHKRLSESGKKSPVTPDPENLWQIVKDAHNRSFLDPIQMLDPELSKNGCNIIMSTTLGAIKGEKQRQSAERKNVREALGITMDIEGWPRLPTYPDSVFMLSEGFDGHWARTLKDRGPERKLFMLEEYDSFYLSFLTNCRQD